MSTCFYVGLREGVLDCNNSSMLYLNQEFANSAARATGYNPRAPKRQQDIVESE